ncbi:hypothetical protein [Streptantibioticus ferralitis]|uniref:DUF2958 domain-containing protein n=1 Tax=Streptantibioticus ferralitis TaxID=236510 RepID=A0ABT5Z3I3_9ACTN|nr:hypothetical protein [Streptantibioticus ferralitis]MDF2258363.1 hypothetical protein [Streptantibioticus ferralitis]
MSTEFIRLPEVHRDLRGHEFYPPAGQMAKIPPLYATEDVPSKDKIMHVRYFASWGEWYVAELDPNTGLAYGWAVLGNYMTQGEWGYFDLPALESIGADYRPPQIVQRDLWHTPQPAHDCLPKGRFRYS